jgi:anti-anti-sigma regulatory factor
MPLHVLSHPWEVHETDTGPLVKLTHRDLNVRTVSILTDELFELALESDGSNLFVDFEDVRFLATVVPGKLFSLNRRLRESGKRLVLCNLSPPLNELFPAEHWPDGSTPA